MKGIFRGITIVLLMTIAIFIYLEERPLYQNKTSIIHKITHT